MPSVIGGLINQSSFPGAAPVGTAAHEAAYLEPVFGSKFLVSSPDVAFVTAGHPTAAIQDIATQQDLVLLPVAADKADALIKKYPFYAKQLVKANTYPGQTGDINTVAVKAMLVVPESLDADTVYKMTKAIYANTDRLKAAHKLGEGITKESALEGMPITVHPGADKFFKEK